MPKKTVKRRAQPKTAGRSRRGFGFVYAVVSTLAVIGVVLAGLTVFFRLENYEIIGATRYGRTDIIVATGLEKGDNLYFFNKFSIQRDMLSKLPYIGEIRLTRRLPKTLVITIRETDAAVAVEDGESYVLVDAAGKVLECTSEPGTAAVVSGVELTDIRPGERITTVLSRQEKTLTEILSVLASNGLLSRVSAISLDGAYSVTLTYMEKIEVRLGFDDGRTERKIRALGEVLAELPGDTAGVLDMTGEDYRFVPSRPEVSPTPTPSPETPENGTE